MPVTIIGLIAAACTTLAFLPQAIKTWRTRSTADLSLPMFLLMTFGVALWMVYGLILGDWPLIIGNGLTLLLSGSILYCKLRYG